MKLQVILSLMNLKREDLAKMNITSKCVVINQCDKNDYEKYENFDIYSYTERGAANSRNRGLEHSTEDILLLCDDDVVYNEGYEEKVITEFRNNPEADVIIFNMYSPNRKKREIKKRKRLHLYNSLHYATCNIAFRKKSIGNIKFNPLFGPNGTYGKAGGDDTMFLVSCLNNKLKIYSCPEYLGTVYHDKSTWFNGINEKFFFDKGALFTAINRRYRLILIYQFLLRHKEFLTNMKFSVALKHMLDGSRDYIKRCDN